MTDWFQVLISTFLAFMFLLVVFVPMERVFPAVKGQAFFRPHWLLDLSFMLGQYLLWSTVVLWCMVQLHQFWYQVLPQGWRDMVSYQPYVLQVAEVLVLSDLLIYWGHRLQHKVDFLWRFHKVHHSAKHLDWMASHREHPLDSIYTIGLINLPAFVMGFPLEAIAGIIAFRGIWAIYIHANVRLPLGPLKKIIGSPELHHWHHCKARDVGNYANISPLMDILFGTYVCPDHEPEELGINEQTPATYLGQLIEPMLPARSYDKMVNKLTANMPATPTPHSRQKSGS